MNKSDSEEQDTIDERVTMEKDSVLQWNADNLTVKRVSVGRTCGAVVKWTLSAKSIPFKLQRLQRKGGNLCSQTVVSQFSDSLWKFTSL